ncbi:MAG: transporter substrate-binding domain-containing protein, partial [Chloroflexales bacterium]|nr:transporter substrate-binding domain-containing protein [Chloroflexales bacterium]
MNRTWQAICAVLLTAMLLAACGAGGTGATTGATTAPDTAATTGTTTDATATTGTTTDATATTPAAAGATVADLKGRVLIIGSDTTYPPMESVNDQKEIVGFDVDMMNELAKRMNATVEFRTFPNFDAIFAALANKEFDMVVSSVSITDERKKIIAFSDPYLSIGQVITVPAANTTITGQDTLKSAQLVGVQGGTTGEEAAKAAGVPEAQIKRYDTIDLAFADLSNGAVDAVIADGPPSAQYATQYAGKIKAVGGPFTTEDYGIAL